MLAEHTGKRIIVAAHVGTIRALTARALGAPLESMNRMELAPASITTLTWYADGNASMRSFAESGHLEGLASDLDALSARERRPAVARRRLVSPTGSYAAAMELEFDGEIWFWRGPSPYHFVTVPDEECAALASTASVVSYGWGMIPVTGRIGATSGPRRSSRRTAATSCP